MPGRIVIVAAEQARFQAVEVAKLLGLAKARMVGDVVGDAHELVEGQDGAAVPRLDQPRGHREILIPRALAGSQLRSV